jgi:hypothetical protein
MKYLKLLFNLTIGRYLDYWWEKKYLPLRLRIGEAAMVASLGAKNNFKYLWDAEVCVFSQNGEDGILSYICDQLSIGKPSMIEIGAGNFSECNSRYLAERRNANVLAVDKMDGLVENILKLPVFHETNIQALNTLVTSENINSIIGQGLKFFEKIDILSIDIDGNDYWVLHEADLTGIRIVVVEFNPLLGKNRPVSVPRNDYFDRTSAHYSWTYYGANLLAFEFLLKQKGFALIGTTRKGSNAFFVEESSLTNFPLVLNSQEMHDVRARENRNNIGELSYVSGKDRQKIIFDMEVIDVRNGDIVKVAQCW